MLVNALLAAGVLAPAAGLALLGRRKSEPQSADTRPILRIAMPADPIDHVLDPQRENSLAGQRYMYNLFDSLLAIDYGRNWRLKPALAEAWRRIDDRTVEFDLRPGVRFHNGQELTSEDVAFSLSPERILAPSWPGSRIMRQYWGGLDRIEPINRHRVRVIAKRPDPVLEFRLAAGGSQIISQTAFRAAPNVDSWSRHPVGTGPYRVDTFRSGDVARYLAFDDYWGGRPAARAIEWRVVPDSSTRVVGLLTGEYDIVTDLDPSQVPVIASKPGVRALSGSSGAMYMLTFDTRNPLLADRRIREALALAIDRELIAATLWEGLLQPPEAYQWRDFGPLFAPGREATPYDPERARRLLAAAGYDGRSIPFNVTNNYYVSEVQTAQILADMWERVGLRVEISVHADFSNLGGGIRYGSTSMYYPDPVGSVVRVWGRGSYWDNQGVLEGVAVRERLFALGDELSTVVDMERRRRAFSELLDIVEEEHLIVPIIEAPLFYGAGRSLDWTVAGSPMMDFRPGKLRFRNGGVA